MTARLLNTAKARWSAFDGWAAATMSGADPLDLPFDRLLNLIYHWIVKDADPDEVPKFDARLWRPPPGRAAAPGSPWSPEAETAAFRGLAAAIKGGPPARDAAP